MKRTRSMAGFVFVAAFALNAVAVSSSQALPPLGCYLVNNIVAGKQGGDFSKSTAGKCESKVAVLTGKWVVAEPVFSMGGDVYCAKIDEFTLHETGTWKENKCISESSGNKGEFIEVKAPLLLPPPDIHILSGESYPLHLSFSDNKPTATKLSNAAGGKWVGTGLLALFLTVELASRGSFEILFVKILEPKEKAECNTAGDKTGEVLLKGSFQIVALNATGSELAVLYLFKEFDVECNKGKKTLEVKGDFLSKINLGTTKESEDYTSLCNTLEGNGKGKPTVTEYNNESGEKVKAKLESELGSGFGESAEEVVGEFCPEALASKMFLILNR